MRKHMLKHMHTEMQTNNTKRKARASCPGIFFFPLAPPCPCSMAGGSAPPLLIPFPFLRIKIILPEILSQDRFDQIPHQLFPAFRLRSLPLCHKHEHRS